MKIVINANSLHQGGSKVIMNSILDTISSNEQVIVFIDERFPLEKICKDNIQFIKVQRSFLSRFFAEFKIKSLINKEDIFLSFTNLPPFFRLKGKTKLLIHNKFTLYPFPLKGFKSFVKFRITLERFLFRLFKYNIDEVIVQTSSMEKLAKEIFSHQTQISKCCFTESINLRKKENNEQKNKFIYVSSGEPYKNHNNLFEAWKILAEKNIYPELTLTLDRYKDSQPLQLLQDTKYKNLKITNIERLNHQEILELYLKHNA